MLLSTPPITAAMVLDAAARLFPGDDLRSISQRWRPRICPLEAVVNAIPAECSLLDIGCGSGLLLGVVAITRPGVRGVGSDPSIGAIGDAERMRQKLPPDRRDRLQFVVRSESDPSLEPADVVSMVDVLHHIPRDEQRQAFHRAVNRIRPGGLLVFKDMRATPRWRAAANTLHDLLLARQIVHYVSEHEIDAWGLDERLTPLQSASYDRLWYAHFLRVFRRP